MENITFQEIPTNVSWFRAQVCRTAYKTAGGLKKKDLKKQAWKDCIKSLKAKGPNFKSLHRKGYFTRKVNSDM